MINHNEWDYIISALNKLDCSQEAMQIRHIMMTKELHYQQEKERMKEEILKELRSEFNISVDTTSAVKAIKDLEKELRDFGK